MKVRLTIAVGICLVTGHVAPKTVLAQAPKDVRASDTPLVLKSQGTFFVGGEKVRANSHMIMQDSNNLQIADFILEWIDREVSRRGGSTGGALEVQDYATLPITADNTNDNTRAQLARVNFMRDEPGGRRFFVNDLNGPLYILDKQTKTFTRY